MNKLNATYASQRTVGAVFRNTKYAEGHEQVYTYLVPDNLNPKEGDLGIVEKDGVYSIVTTRRVDKESKVDVNATYRYKWLVGIVDPIPYLTLVQKEDVFIKQKRV